MKVADKDMLETLAALEFGVDMECEGAAQGATTFRRLAREAGYEFPADFDWQEHLPEYD